MSEMGEPGTVFTPHIEFPARHRINNWFEVETQIIGGGPHAESRRARQGVHVKPFPLKRNTQHIQRYSSFHQDLQAASAFGPPHETIDDDSSARAEFP